MSASFRVLVTDGVSEKGVEALSRDPRIEVVVKPSFKEADLLPIADQFDAIVVRSQTKITAKIIQAATRLKAVGRAGVGVDNVDVDAATARGVIVMNTPGGNTISTAEHTFSLILSLARNIPHAHASIKAGEWDRKSFQGVELCGKTLGIVGMGRIGGEVARRAIGFGMRVVAYDPYLSQSRARSLQVELADTLDALLPQADFITVHMPLTPETQNMFNSKSIAKCKKGVRLINCARGGLINEADLFTALQSGHVAGAALDVFEVEPPAPELPFRSLKNVVLTPHLGASTAEAQESVGIEIADAIYDLLINGVVQNAVNLPSLDAKTLAVLKPFLTLGQQLGKFLAQISPRGCDSLTVNYSGRLPDMNTTPVTRAILKGFLHNAGGAEVNEVNAPKLAEALGLKVSETKASEPGDFTELIHITTQAGTEKHEVSATFFGSRPKIVGIDGNSLECSPEGTLLIIENEDVPGMVGKMGTLLGKHGVNIANMSLSRSTPGSRAFVVLNVDGVPGDDVLAAIRSEPNIHRASVVKF